VKVELARIAVGLVREVRELEPAPRLRLGARAIHGYLPEHGRQRDVLQHGQVIERPRDLVSTRNARPGDAMRRPAHELLAFEKKGTRVRGVMAAHHVDERRLSGAVRPYEPKDLPAAHLEARLRQRLHALERLADIAGDEDRLARNRGQSPI